MSYVFMYVCMCYCSSIIMPLKILYIMCIEYCMLCILFCPGIPHNNRNNNNSNDINGSRKAVEVIMLVFMH